MTSVVTGRAAGSTSATLRRPSWTATISASGPSTPPRQPPRGFHPRSSVLTSPDPNHYTRLNCGFCHLDIGTTQVKGTIMSMDVTSRAGVGRAILAAIPIKACLLRTIQGDTSILGLSSPQYQCRKLHRAVPDRGSSSWISSYVL